MLPRLFLLAYHLVLSGLCAAMLLTSNQSTSAQKGATQSRFEPKGKVVTRAATDFHKLPSPITQHPVHAPPPREGHGWRWHPLYGRWILLPNAGIPAEVVLPATYILPAKVEVFESESAGGCICPYCGHPLEIR